MYVPAYWCGQKERYQGGVKRPCCGLPEIRKGNEFLPCPECGTKRTWTEDGLPVTEFGEKYLKQMRRKAGVELGIQVKIPKRRLVEVETSVE